MLCGWGSSKGRSMACLQVKLCVAISERFGKRSYYLKALYECPGLYFTYFILFLLFGLCRFFSILEQGMH